jgi:cation transport ATPase
MVLFQLSRAITFTIYRNFGWAFCFNIVGIPFAAGIFYPYFLPPMYAGMAMAFSSILVVTSSLFLKWFRPKL